MTPLTERALLKNRKRGERGAAAVEFALITSILLMLLFGIFEYGRTFSEIEVLTSAAREGARVAAVRGTPSEIEQRVREAASPYEVKGDPVADKTCDDATSGEAVTVSWNQPIDISIAFVPAYHRDVVVKGVFRCE
jgi:Flp pilus assembly protein TadG